MTVTCGVSTVTVVPTATVVVAPEMLPPSLRQRAPRLATGEGIVTESIVRQVVVLSW